MEDSIIFPKLLKATYEEQIVDIINVPTEGQILMKESTYTFPITESTYETWKKIERYIFLKHMNYTVTFKLIMMNNKEHIHIYVKHFVHKGAFEQCC